MAVKRTISTTRTETCPKGLGITGLLWRGLMNDSNFSNFCSRCRRICLSFSIKALIPGERSEARAIWITDSIPCLSSGSGELPVIRKGARTSYFNWSWRPSRMRTNDLGLRLGSSLQHSFIHQHRCGFIRPFQRSVIHWIEKKAFASSVLHVQVSTYMPRGSISCQTTCRATFHSLDHVCSSRIGNKVINSTADVTVQGVRITFEWWLGAPDAERSLFSQNFMNDYAECVNVTFPSS